MSDEFLSDKHIKCLQIHILKYFHMLKKMQNLDIKDSIMYYVLFSI